MSGSAVTINKHRILQVKGRPFFPIAARHIPIGATPALLKEVGFNAVRWTPFGMDTLEEDSWTIPHDLDGLSFYAYLYNRGDLSSDVERRRRELTRLVDAIKDHPNLLCYEQRNEPAYSHKNYAKAQSPPEGLIAGSNVIRSLDPNHPIRVGHMCCNLVATLRKYNPAVDIVGCNPSLVSQR